MFLHICSTCCLNCLRYVLHEFPIWSEYRREAISNEFLLCASCLYLLRLSGFTVTTCVCFQNAMRATNELHEGSEEGLPPIKAKVTLGKEDLSVKVSFFIKHVLCQHRDTARLDPDLSVFFYHRSVIEEEVCLYGRLTGCLTTPTRLHRRQV